MSQRVRVFQVDAFTSRRFSGNPAGVVLDADALCDNDVQALARELHNGDTAFVLQPDASDHDLRVRFFTPRGETAFIGHATLAAHAVLAALELEPLRRQKQIAGIVEVDRLGATAPPRIAIHQGPPGLKRELAADELKALLEALALQPGDLDPQCPAVIAGDNSTRVLLGIAAAAILARARPDPIQLTALSARLGAPGFFLFTRAPAVAGVYTEARMFCPALGIPEDPVSGNAHGLLGAYLLRYGLIGPRAGLGSQHDTIEFTGAQGHHVGRPGLVTVALNVEHNLLKSVSIIGEAVIVFNTTIQL